MLTLTCWAFGESEYETVNVGGGGGIVVDGIELYHLEREVIAVNHKHECRM